MFDEFFADLHRDLDALREDISELKSHINRNNVSEPKLFDTKAIARVSGIPYSTLINKKHLLPHVSKSVKIVSAALTAMSQSS
jgi:hypothetical protein